MSCPTNNPVAPAWLDQGDVVLVAGHHGAADAGVPTARLQVRHLLARFALSHPLAAVIAEHAFGEPA